MPANADDLISEDDFVRDERLPYWADLWPSARILAEELAVMRLRGQRVLELGCGLGVVAIGAVIGGADVTATDYYEDATLLRARERGRGDGNAHRDAHGELGARCRRTSEVRRRARVGRAVRASLCVAGRERHRVDAAAGRRGDRGRSGAHRARRSSSTSAPILASSTRAIRVPSSRGRSSRR